MIKKTYNDQDIGNFLDCFLEIEDSGFKIDLEIDILMDAYPYGFLYNPHIWNSAKRQWNTPWEGDPSKMPSMDATRGGIITNYHSDLIRVKITGSKELLMGIDFYENVINIHRPLRSDSVNQISLKNLENIRSNILMRKIKNISGFYLYNSQYYSLTNGKGSIILEFIHQ